MKKILLIPSEKLFKTKDIDKNNHPPSNIMQWIIFLIYFSNILVAIITNTVYTGNISNTICGIVLMFTLPLPAKILYNKHGYGVQNNIVKPLNYNEKHGINKLDVIAVGQSASWIISYTLWDLCFLCHYAPETIFFMHYIYFHVY